MLVVVQLFVIVMGLVDFAFGVFNFVVSRSSSLRLKVTSDSSSIGFVVF